MILSIGILAGLTTTSAQAATTAAPPAAPAAGKPATLPVTSQAEPVDPAVTAAEQSAATEAKKSRKPVVVDALTRENVQTVANPDGSFTLTQNATPVRARQGNAWVPIDTKLAKRADGTFAPGASDSDLAFSGGGDGPLVTMTRTGKRLAISWPGTLPAPVVSGDTATYPAVLPDVDLAVTARADGFSEVLVVKSAAAAANPALATIHLATRTDGLTISQTSGGDAEAKDAAGTTVFRADPPLVWDSAQAVAPAVPRALPQAEQAPAAPPAGLRGLDSKASDVRGPGGGAHTTRMGFDVGRDGLTITPDKALLTSPKTVYPVFIDPQWTGSPSVVSWASINDQGWKATSGNQAKVGDVGDWPGCGDYCYAVHRSYFEMNTDGFRNVGAKVTAAKFTPYFTWTAADNEPTEVYADADFGGDLSWGTKPSSGSSSYVTTCNVGGSGGCGTGQIDFDVTSVAQGAATGGWRTFEVDAPNEGDKFQWKQIDPTQTNWTVTYFLPPTLNDASTFTTTPSVTGPGGGRYVNSHNVTLQALGADPDSEKVQSGYEIWNTSNGSVTTEVAGGLFSAYTATGGSVQYSNLADGTYAWRGVTHSQDGGMWSGWGAWQPFTVDASQPPAAAVESPQFPQNQFGAAFQDNGTFTFTTYGSGHVAGYLISLDGDLGNAAWSQQSPPPTVPANGPLTTGRTYWLPATNTVGTTTFPIPTVGAHHVYAKTVSWSGIAAATQTSYGFWAGVTSPKYVYGDQLVNGYTATNDDKSTTAVPKATWTAGAGGVLQTQSDCCGIHWADGQQALYTDSTTGHTALNDTVTFNFDVPHDGYWSLGANFTQSAGFGQFKLVLDQGSATQSTVLPLFDGYHDSVVTSFQDFGPPLDTAGKPIKLSQGLHTLTMTMTGKNAATVGYGYKAGLDVLRLAPMSATCPIGDLAACQNNIAVSPDTNHLAADADGSGASFSAGQLTSAGWRSGTPVTINGALMTVPSYATGKADNILAAGQTVTVDPTSSANAGNAVVFLAFATGGSYTGTMTGTVTYPTVPGTTSSTCGTSVSHPYHLDMVPDWTSGAPSSHAVGFAGRNTPTGTDAAAPQLFPISVALDCPGVPIQSITLPVVTNRLRSGTAAVHIMGVGIRPASYDPASGQNWNGSWAAQQDTTLGTWTDQTLRIPARLSIGDNAGGKVRIHLSNTLGTTAITFPHVSVALQGAAGGAATAAAPLPVTFAGASGVTIPAGGEMVSDPVTLDAAAQSTLLVSLQLSGSVSGLSAHGVNQSSVYATPQSTGDHTGDTSAAGFTIPVPAVPYLTGVDVTPTSGNTGALALVGDQSVNSDSATPDNAHHLSDLIYTDVVNAYNAYNPNDPNNDPSKAAPPTPYGVLNLGRDSAVTGNNLLPALSGSSTQLAPPSATNPLDRTVLDAADVHTALISTGTSDILSGTSAADIENRLIALTKQIQLRYVDTAPGSSRKITVYVATIPDSPGMSANTAQETVRRTVNSFIRCGRSDPTANVCAGVTGSWLGGNADGEIDFAAAVSTGNTDVGTINAARDLTNNLPNDTYYADLAARYTADSVSPAAVTLQPATTHPATS
ncbi:hypothetical protein [Kitasatospora sp. MAA4]|uniref:hypothetical protein n=1 Tax=Kitasatospora sp. MAA4 TaxID=3035093 RepID=UPI002476530A|nr:hypothetical protein [Kitasatospora sp. MAA4]